MNPKPDIIPTCIELRSLEEPLFFYFGKGSHGRMRIRPEILDWIENEIGEWTSDTWLTYADGKGRWTHIQRDDTKHGTAAWVRIAFRFKGDAEKFEKRWSHLYPNENHTRIKLSRRIMYQNFGDELNPNLVDDLGRNRDDWSSYCDGMETFITFADKRHATYIKLKWSGKI